MIVDTLDHLELYEHLHPGFGKALRLLRDTDFSDKEDGVNYELEGKKLFYFLGTDESRMVNDTPEAHTRYIDIQFHISGRSCIDTAPLESMTEEVLPRPQGDTCFYHGGDCSRVLLEKKRFAVLFPWDAHAPGIAVGEPELGRKCVVKVLADPSAFEEERAPVDFGLLEKQVRALAEADPSLLPLLSNTAAVISESLPDVSWAGFYLRRGEKLVLGPFQGKNACIHIPMGKGVCGTSAFEDRVVRVEDVHTFPGHIACDESSNSEIVLPIHRDGAVAAVLDLDSRSFHRFGELEEKGLLTVVKVLEETLVWQ
jgi:GAF domain-containing protein